MAEETKVEEKVEEKTEATAAPAEETKAEEVKRILFSALSS